MTQYLNKAAVNSWVDGNDSIQERLEKIFVESGFSAETVDTWTNDIIRNSFEAVSEPQSSNSGRREIR